LPQGEFKGAFATKKTDQTATAITSEVQRVPKKKKESPLAQSVWNPCGVMPFKSLPSPHNELHGTSTVQSVRYLRYKATRPNRNDYNRCYNRPGNTSGTICGQSLWNNLPPIASQRCINSSLGTVPSLQPNSNGCNRGITDRAQSPVDHICFFVHPSRNEFQSTSTFYLIQYTLQGASTVQFTRYGTFAATEQQQLQLNRNRRTTRQTQSLLDHI